MAKIAGITIKLDADASGLEKAVKDIDSSLKKTQSNLKEVNRLLKLDPSSTDLLTQKQKALQDAVTQTGKRLEALKEAQSQVKEGSAEWEALQQEIVVTEQKLKQAEDEFKNFGSVAKQQIKAVSDKMKEIGQNMTSVGKRLTTSVTLPIVAGFTAAAKTASDFEENMNKIDVAFGDSAEAVKNWSNNALHQFGLSKVAASDAVSGFGALGKGIGLTSETAAGMATTLAGLSADLASYFNTGTEDSAKALEGIFTGEAEALKKFGVVMNDTNLKQFAEDQGLVWKELDQTQKTMLRYQYVLDKTKDAQGDYSRTSDGTANSVKTFQAALSDLGTTIGTQLLPLVTPLIQKATEILTKFSELDPKTQKLIVVIGLAVAAIGPLITILGGLAIGISALLSPIGLVVAAIAAVIAIGVILYKHWDDLKAQAKDLADRLTEKWNELKDNVSNAVENIKLKVTTAWDNIKTKVGATVAVLVGAVTTAWDGLKTAISTAIDTIKAKIDSFKEKLDSLKTKAQSVIDRVKQIFSGEISLPKIKMPHFSITGNFSLNPPRVPSISVQWYKKAYENAVMFSSPTVMATPNGMKGFGDGHGAEIVMGLNKLRELVGTSNVTINVYPSAGMNETQLAEMVQNKLVQLQKQRDLAYA